MSSQTTDAARDRYLALIDATLRHALTTRKTAGISPNSMAAALVAIARRLGLAIDVPIDVAFDGPIVDGAGNTRQVYRPILMRAIAPFIERRGQLDAYSDAARAAVHLFAADPAPLLVSDGATIVARLFDALAIHAIVGSTPEADAAFSRTIAAQSDDGTFLTRTSADQLEPAWYHELAVLHAVRVYADETSDVAARGAAARSARYHAEQVQPDHASSHPFGLAALLDDAEGIHLADMMLHAAGVQQPAKMDATSLVLLSDALDCGRRAKPA